MNCIVIIVTDENGVIPETYNDFNDYYGIPSKDLLNQANFGSISEDAIKFVANHCLEEGILPSFINYLIEYFSDSSSFDIPNNRYNYAIKP